MNTHDTVAWVCGVLWCAKNPNRTHTCDTRFGNTAGLPVPILKPNFPPVSEHRITVLSQIVIMLVENYVDWMLRAEIYKRKKGQNVSCIYLRSFSPNIQ